MLIADAGFMYVAKMSGAAPLYDLFTPDVGELAFLADEDAPAPLLHRGFILHEDNSPDLIARAYSSGMEIGEAATPAARINRLAGHYANPTPATQVMQMIRHIPRAVEEALLNRKTLSY